MKLILQNDGGTIYAYFETEKHFKRVENQRRGARIQNPRELLAESCELEDWLVPGTHMVIEVKK